MSNTQSVFARRARERREALGMTQAEAAAAIGRGQSYISMIESGALHPPPLENARPLAEVYQTSLDYLSGLTDDPRPPSGQSPPPYGVELWDILRALSDERAASVVESARALLRAEVEARNKMIDALRLAVGAAAGDESAQALLVEAFRLSAAGDVSAAIGLIEGYRARTGEGEREALNHN